MTKDELIARLTELGKKLNRDVLFTGSKEELALRVAELEEELEGDGGDSSGDIIHAQVGGAHSELMGDGATPSEKGKASTEQSAGDLVLVETCATVHVDAWHQTRNEKMVIVPPGVIIRISLRDATTLIDMGLARQP